MKASVGPFLQGVSKASSGLTGFLARASSATGLTALGSSLASVGAQAKKAGSDWINLKTVFLGGVGAIAAAGAGLTALAVSSLHTIDKQGELAEKLGVTGGSLAAFEYAVKLTGGPVETLSEILGKLNGTLGLAARQATPAGEAIRRLGLDAKVLADAGPIEATKAIADQLAKIENPARRASIATQIFGEQGAKLAGTFKVGSKGISDLEAEAKKLGISLSETDYAKVAAANDALDRASGAITGIGNKIAVALTPYIESAANRLTDLAIAGQGFGPVVARSMEIAATGIAYVADVANGVKILFQGLGVAVVGSLTVVIAGIDGVGKAIESILNLLPGVKVSFTGTLDSIVGQLGETTTGLARDLSKSLDTPPPSTGIKAFFDDLRKSADASAAAIASTSSATKGLGIVLSDTGFKVGELETKLKEQIATYGFSAEALAIYKLKQEGASTEELQSVRALSKKFAALEKNVKAEDQLKDAAKSLYDDTRTPLEKLDIEGTKLKKLFDSNLIDPTTFKRGLEKAKADAGFGDQDKRAGALELGSKEARSTLLSFRDQRENPADDAAKKTASATEKTAKATIETVTLLRKALTNPNVATSDILGL